MKRIQPVLLATSLLLTLILAGCAAEQNKSAASAAAPGANDISKGGGRFERQGWVYVHLEGAPDRIGYQHGSLLSKEIDDLLRVMKPFLERQSKHDWNFYRASAEKMLWPGIDRE